MSNDPKDPEPGEPQPSRRLGFLKGQFAVPEDLSEFDMSTQDEIEALFYGDLNRAGFAGDVTS